MVHFNTGHSQKGEEGACGGVGGQGEKGGGDLISGYIGLTPVRAALAVAAPSRARPQKPPVRALLSADKSFEYKEPEPNANMTKYTYGVVDQDHIHA